METYQCGIPHVTHYKDMGARRNTASAVPRLTKPVQNSPEGTLAVHFPFGMPLRARQKPQGALTDKKSKGEKTKADLEPS